MRRPHVRRTSGRARHAVRHHPLLDGLGVEQGLDTTALPERMCRDNRVVAMADSNPAEYAPGFALGLGRSIRTLARRPPSPGAVEDAGSLSNRPPAPRDVRATV